MAHHLITRCIKGKKNAWSELWSIYDHFAAKPVRRLLERAGFGAFEAEEIALALFERLWMDDHRRLRSFRGTTDAELHTWLVHMAINVTRDHLRRVWRDKRRDSAAQKSTARPNRDGPTTESVAALIADLERVWPKKDVDRLCDLAGLSSATQSASAEVPRDSTSDRTRRREDRKLVDKVSEHLGVTPPRSRKNRPPRPTPDSRLPTPDSRLPTPDSRLPTTDEDERPTDPPPKKM